MAKLTWHEPGEKEFERGVQDVALFVFNPNKTGGAGYDSGVAWNGCTNITESPSGAEPTPFYADNKKYAELRSIEEFGITIEAYNYPDPEWLPCDGLAEPVRGMAMGQQPRRSFALVYRTEVGNDLMENAGYKLHIAYGLTASPAEKAYPTINDSPEIVTFSWECSSLPVHVAALANARPTSIVTLNSMDIGATAMQAIEDVLYGSASGEAELLMPDDIFALIEATVNP
jgi:hypothetical protein